MPINFGMQLATGVRADLDNILIRKTSTLNPLGAYYAIWGNNTDGGIGDSTTVHRSSPVAVSAVYQSDVYKSINRSTSKNTYTAVIQGNQYLYMAGDNTNGQLGQNNTTKYSSPVQVGTKQWEACSVGGNTTAAIDIDGRLFTWGNNDTGQLGVNDTTHRSSPVLVGGFNSLWFNASVSDGTTAAIRRSDKALFTWGNNTYGQLGQNTVTHRSSPIQVGTSSWVSVTSGNFSFFAIRHDGRLFTWGDNGSGQLGQNDTVHRSSPVQVDATNSWTKVASCGDATLAIRLNGSLWAWGSNVRGQLGQNDVTTRSSPVQIGIATDWIDINCDARENTMYAIKQDGTLWAWGGNSRGSIGDNSTMHRSSPVSIGAGQLWSRVAPGAAWV